MLTAYALLANALAQTGLCTNLCKVCKTLEIKQSAPPVPDLRPVHRAAYFFEYNKNFQFQ